MLLAYEVDRVPVLAQVTCSDGRHRTSERVSCGNDSVGGPLLYSCRQYAHDLRLDELPRVVETRMDGAACTSRERLLDDVQVGDPIAQRSASSERQDNQLSGMVDRYEASPIHRAYTVRVSVRDLFTSPKNILLELYQCGGTGSLYKRAVAGAACDLGARAGQVVLWAIAGGTVFGQVLELGQQALWHI